MKDSTRKHIGHWADFHGRAKVRPQCYLGLIFELVTTKAARGAADDFANPNAAGPGAPQTTMRA